MLSFFTPGTIAGLLSFASALSVALHNPVLGAFLANPTTANSATAVLTGVTALVAGALQGLKAKA